MENQERIPVIIQTSGDASGRGRTTLFAYILPSDIADENIKDAKKVRMVMYWATTAGLAQLAATGPTENSRLGAECDWHIVRDVKQILACTPEAVSAFKNHPTWKG